MMNEFPASKQQYSKEKLNEFNNDKNKDDNKIHEWIENSKVLKNLPQAYQHEHSYNMINIWYNDKQIPCFEITINQKEVT